jgi:hypothetical protein
MMSRIVIAGSSAYDVDASSASRLLPSPTRPPRVDPADLTHLCAGITIGGGTATSGSAPGDEIGSASAPGGNANGPVGVGVGEGEGLASILATAGTICFDARLGAGDLNPNGGATRAGLAACGVVAFALAGFFPAGVPLSRAVLNLLGAFPPPAATPDSLDFFLASPPFSPALFPSLDPVLVPPSPSSLARFAVPLASRASPSPSPAPLSPSSRPSLVLDADRFTFGANALARRACVAVGRASRASSRAGDSSPSFRRVVVVVASVVIVARRSRVRSRRLSRSEIAAVCASSSSSSSSSSSRDSNPRRVPPVRLRRSSVRDS